MFLDFCFNSYGSSSVKLFGMNYLMGRLGRLGNV